MGADKFKFISPGVFTEEIDESNIPALPERMGPLVIGRFEKGPSNRPVRVNSFREFVSIFGNPSAGSVAGDVWRSGEATAPTYAAYAVQALLRNNSPCTVYRVLGEQADNATAGSATALAGWNTDQSLGKALATAGGAYGLFIIPNPDSFEASTDPAGSITITTSNAPDTGNELTLVAANGDSLVFTVTNTNDADGTASPPTFGRGGSLDGLNHLKTSIEASSLSDNFTVGSVGGEAGARTLTITQVAKGVSGNTTVTSNCANWNINGAGAATSTAFAGGAGPAVTGSLAAVWYVQDGAVILTGTARDGRAQEGTGIFIKGDSGSKFTVKVVKDAMSTVQKQATFNFDRDSDLFIRKVFNADPTKTNDAIVPTSQTTQSYWLGETFESNFVNAENSKLAVTGTLIEDNQDVLGVILGLEGSGNLTWANHQQASRAAQTGWFISQDTRGTTTSGFDPTSHTEKLFKFHALDSG